MNFPLTPILPLDRNTLSIRKIMPTNSTDPDLGSGSVSDQGSDKSALIQIIVGVLVLIGLVARLSPFMDVDGRLFWQYMTEDGYLMQTVARNMAIGLGMTTAEGTIPTNGVQPLATFLFAGMHFLAQGDKTLGIALVALLSTLIALISAWLLARIGQIVFGHLPQGRNLANAAAALWFSAPLITRHSMNGLETGLYHASLLLCMLFFLRRFCTANAPGWSDRLLLGLLLGLTFLARNDAVFFIASILMVHLLIPVPGRNETGLSRLTTTLVAGLVSVLVASPWLINNYLGFGSIIPISGTAQSHWAEFGKNLPWVAAHLFENAWLWLPVPSSFETLLPVQILTSSVTVTAFAIYWLLVGKHASISKIHFLASLLFAAGLAAYYGLYFGASWFLPRYLSAASPFLWLFIVGGIYAGARAAFTSGRIQIAAAYIGLMSLAVMGVLFAANNYLHGTTHMHKQVVDWTQTHLDSTVWIGAPQTGTLGYFHDRTINLDGKVNPEALGSMIKDGHILDYVLASPVQYIVDWVGMAQWVHMGHQSTRFGQEFQVIVEDSTRNLAVLKRQTSAP